jgi:hypothetical protein
MIVQFTDTKKSNVRLLYRDAIPSIKIVFWHRYGAGEYNRLIETPCVYYNDHPKLKYILIFDSPITPETFKNNLLNLKKFLIDNDCRDDIVFRRKYGVELHDTEIESIVSDVFGKDDDLKFKIFLTDCKF